MPLAVPDLVGPDLRLLFCGINPGTLSGQLGLHFARSGNRFWKLLHAAGFTDAVLLPSEQHILPSLGIGITNLVERATAGARDLHNAELGDGARRLEAKVTTLRHRRDQETAVARRRIDGAHDGQRLVRVRNFRQLRPGIRSF